MGNDLLPWPNVRRDPDRVHRRGHRAQPDAAHRHQARRRAARPGLKTHRPCRDDQGEVAYLSTSMHYSRLYGGSGEYMHTSNMAFGKPGFVLGMMAMNAAVNAGRRNAARKDMQPLRLGGLPAPTLAVLTAWCVLGAERWAADPGLEPLMSAAQARQIERSGGRPELEGGQRLPRIPGQD